MNKLKLSELIEIETSLHKERLTEELQSINSYRESQPDNNSEYEIDAAKAYLTRRGYSDSEIENTFKDRNKKELVIYKEGGIIKLEDAISVLEKDGPNYKTRTKEIYIGLKETRKFMLKNISSRNIELMFHSKIGIKEADVKIKGMLKFVSIDVDCTDNDYSYYADFYPSFGNVEGRIKYKSSIPPIIGACFIPIINIIALGVVCHEFLQDGPIGLGTDLCRGNKKENMIISKAQIEKSLLFKNDTNLKIYEHIVRLKEETERELIKQANEKF